MSGLFTAEPVDLESVRLELVGADRARVLAEAIATLSPWSDLSFTAAGLEAYLTRPDPALFRYAVLSDGALAGVIGIRSPWLRGPYLEQLAILPGFQGRGIGRELLDWMEERAAGRAKNLWVLASDFNAGALRFYEAHGFERIAPLADLVRPGYGEIMLRKRLD